jgi:hypothetical protein
MTQPDPATIDLTLDRSTYAPGETITATVQYHVPADSSAELTARLRFLGGVVETPPTEVQIAELELDDSAPDREWTLQSNDGDTAVFTAVA